MFWWILLFLVSIALLVKSSDYFTKSAEKIGIYFHMPAFVIGVIILSVGTSLPELISSIFAVLQNSPEIVIGNVVGSNIANILLIIGVASLFLKNNPIKRNLTRIDLPILLISLIFALITLYDGVFTWIEGIIGIIIMGIYLYKLNSKNEKIKIDVKLEKNKPPYKAFLYLILTSIGVFFGAKYTIVSVVEIATLLNISKTIIAASAVALGTSLPELSVSIQAAKKKNFDMALGNVIGSNIFNTFIVLGIPSFISILKFDMTSSLSNPNFLSIIALLISTILLSWYVIDSKITRKEGIMLTTLYVIFIVMLFI